jgi:hypothetical protein
MSYSGANTSGRALWRESSFWSGWVFGTLAAAVGLISFVQHVFGVHLIPVYAHGLDVYRVVIHSVIDWLYAPAIWLAQSLSRLLFHFHLKIAVPDWWKDLTVISTLAAGTLIRTGKLAKPDIPRTTKAAEFIIDLAIIILLGVTLLGLLTLVAMLFGLIGLAMTFARGFAREDVKSAYMRRYPQMTSQLIDSYDRAQRIQILTLLALILASTFFFVTNAYLQ